MPTIFRTSDALLGSGPAATRGPATIVVSDSGVIAAILNSADAEVTPTAGTVEVTVSEGQVLIPGIVDTHVHTNEPGRTEWEGFSSVTHSAAAGGVTTMIDMPLNSIPSTVTMDALELKKSIARDKILVDAGFWAGAVPGNVGTGELRRLWNEGRVFGFKCFLIDSGVEEFAPLNPEQLRTAMTEIADFDGLLIVHAEDPGQIEAAHRTQHDQGGVGTTYSSFVATRPAVAESAAISTVIEIAGQTGCRVHILHLSDAGSIAQIKSAKQMGVKITAETCPHYLALLSENIPDGATQFKCCPPIRSADNRDALWKGLAEGIIDTIGSDHSPCTIDLKRLDTGSFGDAWGGIASIQVSLPVVWSQAHRRGFQLSDVLHWMSAAPAELIGLHDRGSIEVGRRADLVAFSPEEAFTVSAEKLYHRNKISAYSGQHLSGVVQSTWILGKPVFLRTAHDDTTAPAFPGAPGKLTPRP
ncbi:allantoinase AllB [Corynebacterium pacaense]|uniref:allantoinase AllB n=1 Tax=Corynebacterium pacaense TaxID=1816684 RepID=UPI0009B9ECCE|nr:allantoinase AllB [Corynebacterium pacaense]